MNLITSTELRTKTNRLVNALLRGEEVDLVHRSKIIGEITPKRSGSKPVNPRSLAKALKGLEPKRKMTFKDAVKNYEHYMIYRHGPRLSRH